MTTVSAALARATDRLAAAGCEPARVDAEILLAHVLGTTRSGLGADTGRELDAASLEELDRLVVRRELREPLAYVLGEWGFRRLTLSVDSRVLVPRPETEIVVERCLARIDGIAEPRVLDVGTGSGAIALAIADEAPDARVTAIDSDARRARGRARKRLPNRPLRRDRARRPVRRITGRALGSRRVEPAVRPRGRDRRRSSPRCATGSLAPRLSVRARRRRSRAVRSRCCGQGGALVLETAESDAARVHRLLGRARLRRRPNDEGSRRARPGGRRRARAMTPRRGGDRGDP